MKPFSTPEDFRTNLSETILSSRRTPLAIWAPIKTSQAMGGDAVKSSEVAY